MRPTETEFNRAVEILIERYQKKTGMLAPGSLISDDGEKILIFTDIPALPGAFLGFALKEGDDVSSPDALFGSDFSREARIVFSRSSAEKLSAWLTDPQALAKDYQETFGLDLDEALDSALEEIRKNQSGEEGPG